MKIAGLLGVVLIFFPPSSVEGAEGGTGRQLFVGHCASCHGLQGKGDGVVARSLNPKPADLTLIAARRGGDFPMDEIAAYIDGRTEIDAHGTRTMPVWGRVFSDSLPDSPFSEEIIRGQLLSIVEYLESIQRPAWSVRDPEA